MELGSREVRAAGFTLCAGSVVMVLVAVACLLQSGDKAQFWALLWVSQFIVSCALVTTMILDQITIRWLIDVLFCRERRCQCHEQHH